MASDYYKILGVERNASKEEIKKAYKKLAKQHHPDVNKGNAESEKKFKEISEAASVLTDDQKRSHYDRFGTTGGASGAGGSQQGYSDFDFGGAGFGGFEDVFDSFFGGGSGRRGPKKGSDLLYELEITLEDAAFGMKKKIDVSHSAKCKSCDGKGYKKDSDVKTCSTCHGQGRVTRMQRTPFGVFQTAGVCPTCHGQGMEITHACDSCDGTGQVHENKTLEVTVPAGIDEGQRLRVRGEGEAGDRGAPSGDLYVEIKIQKHDVFERDGIDIYCDMPLSFTQAALGDEITVPTLEGEAQLTIPAGTQTGTLFKMANKGIPNIQGYGRGNQFVRVDVDVPTHLSKKQKELLTEFAKTLGDVKPKKRKKGKSFFDKVKEALDQIIFSLFLFLNSN